ncbi:MAG: DUF924 family protein [Maricaulaceae bacterium]
MITPERIIEFWFEQSGPQHWFKQSDAFDAEIRREFETSAVALAAETGRKPTHKWEETRHGTLALLIALDQFPRNMYRGTKAAFTWDHLALGVAVRATDKGEDLKTEQNRRSFFYMPFMHSEDIAMQQRCVELIDSRLDNASTLHHAKEHRRVIERFGRFPHRNKILGRASTSEEVSFLNNGGYSP